MKNVVRIARVADATENSKGVPARWGWTEDYWDEKLECIITGKLIYTENEALFDKVKPGVSVMV